MRKFFALQIVGVGIAAASAGLAPLTVPPHEGVHWPSFRGAHARGIAVGHSLPAHWNVETGENIKWKVPIPSTRPTRYR